MSVINMAKEYNKRPSEMLYLDDPYVSFCFDEACYSIISQWDEVEGKWIKTPKWSEDKVKPKSNKDFIDFVKKVNKNT